MKLAQVVMRSGYRAGGEGSVLFADNQGNVYELDTLNDTNMWPTVSELHIFFK